MLRMSFDLQRVQGTGSDGSDLQEIFLENFLCTEEDKAHQELQIFGQRFVICNFMWCTAFMFILNLIDCLDISYQLWCSWDFQLSITLLLSSCNGQLKGGMISTCFHMLWKPVLTQEMWRNLRRFRLCTRKVCCHWELLCFFPRYSGVFICNNVDWINVNSSNSD